MRDRRPDAEWDLRGATIAQARVRELREQAQPVGERTAVRRARFDGATLEGDIDFSGIDFGGASFHGARFAGAVSFVGAAFGEFADFTSAEFSGDADFRGAQFRGPALFADATFTRRILFRDAEFGDTAVFSQVLPSPDSDPATTAAQEPSPARFGDAADFSNVRVAGNLVMTKLRGKDLDLRKISVRGDVDLDGVVVDVATLASAAVDGDLYLAGAELGAFDASAVHIRGSLRAPNVTCGGPFDVANATLGALEMRRANVHGRAFFDFIAVAWADYEGASFEASVSFRQARVRTLKFGSTRCSGDCDFTEAQLEDEADFGPARHAVVRAVDGAQFDGEVRFVNASVGQARFARVRFAKEARFDGSRFEHGVSFDGAAFAGDGLFANTVFRGSCDFNAVTTTGALALDGAEFDCEFLSLDRASFPHRVSLEGKARFLTCRDTRFGAGARLHFEQAAVALDGADFSGASTLSGTGSKLCSVTEANVSELTVGNLDLRPCRFGAAIGLDKLRLQGLDDMEPNPRSLRLAARRTIAEEHQWRANRGDENWYPEVCRVPSELARPGYNEVRQPAELASIYRALRKGREDDKDEPGAADLYYGEMSMRREALRTGVALRWGERTRRLSERALLTFYWLLSGYGLRASRALVALLLVVIVAGVGLWQVGFDKRPGLHEALLFSLTSVSSLFRAPSVPHPATVVSYGGEWIAVGLRLAGPLILGLLILSVRGRVKR